MNRKRTRNRRVTANWFCRLKVDWLWFCIERNSFKWVEDARDNVIFIVTKCHIHNYFPLAARFMKPIWRRTSGVSPLSEDYFSALFSFFKVTTLPRLQKCSGVHVRVPSSFLLRVEFFSQEEAEDFAARGEPHPPHPPCYATVRNKIFHNRFESN